MEGKMIGNQEATIEEKKLEGQDTKVTTVEKIGKNKILVKFGKPYEFEGKNYTELDLTGMEELTTNDLVYFEDLYNRSNENSEKPEETVMYTIIVVSYVCKLPLEFFNKLPAKDGIKLKKVVSHFFQI